MSHLTPGRLPDGTAGPGHGRRGGRRLRRAAGAGGPGRSGRFRRRYPRGARCAAAGATVLAAALLLGAVLLPDRLESLAPGAFLRLPAEGIALAALLLVLPPRARPVCAAGGGFLIGLLALLKGLDMGFHEVLLRPFDPVLDWGLLGNAADYLRETSGRTGELLAATGAVTGALAVLAPDHTGGAAADDGADPSPPARGPCHAGAGPRVAHLRHARPARRRRPGRGEDRRGPRRRARPRRSARPSRTRASSAARPPATPSRTPRPTGC